MPPAQQEVRVTESREKRANLEPPSPERVRTARGLILIALCAYPIFWFITYQLGMSDPQPLRYIIVLVVIGSVFALSFFSAFVRAHIHGLMILCLYVITIHFFITLYVFNLAIVHVIDMLIYLSVVAACVPFIFPSRRSLLAFFSFIMLGASLLAIAVEDPEINLPQFLAAVAAFAAVGYLGNTFQVKNVNRLKGSEDVLRSIAENWRKYEFIVNTSSEFMTLVNREYVYEAVNDSYCEAHNKKRDEIVGHHVGRVWGEKLFADLIKGYLDECFTGKQVTYQVSFEFAALGLRYFDVTYYPYTNPNGVVTHAVVVSRDNTERKKAEDKLLHDALHDTLTGLPNRNLIMDRLAHSMRRRSRDANYHFAALFLDLDRFKIVNDSLGHLVGDELLIAVARSLEQSTRPGDTVGRIGGDEFVIILEDLTQAEDARIAAERILAAFTNPFKLGENEVYTSASIGIAAFRGGLARPEEMLRDADTAMYRAKSLGRSQHVLFDEAMHLQVRDMLQLESDLRRAVERYELVLYYQPILSLETLATLGFEALLRWRHPVRGMVPPGDFIQLAEETGLIDSIGEWVLGEACSCLRRLHDSGRQDLFISVNVSARQFQKPGFAGVVQRILNESGIPPAKLALELTESLFMGQMNEVSSTLAELGQIGTGLSIDDFGTGYSSMSYLKNLPIHTLKIDQSFVRDLLHDPNDAAITAAIVSMARSLKLQVVAEGVEELAQAKALRELGCEMAQGYLYSRPVPESEIGSLLKHVQTII